MAIEKIGQSDNGQQFYVGQAGTEIASPAVTANPTGSSGAITPESLAPATPVTLPPATMNTTTADNVVGSSQTTQKTIDQYIKEATAPTTELDTKYNTILEGLAKLNGDNTGKTQALAQAKIDSGAVSLSKDLSELNGQIQIGNAEYNKMVQDAEAAKNALPTAGVQSSTYFSQQGQIDRQSASLRASKAAEVGMLAARAAAVAGNLTTALSIAQNAVDAKYAPIEDEIKIKTAQLEALKPLMDEEQQTKATALLRKYTDEQTKVTEEKTKAKENTGLALTAGIKTKYVNKGGEFFNTATGKTFDNPADFFKEAGVKSFEEAYQKGLITDLDNSKIQDISFAQQAQAKYNDIRIPPSASPDEVRQLIKQSKIYQKETYIAPPSGTRVEPGQNPDGTNNVVDTTDERVKEIIAEHPGEWGNAADQIDAEFGKGTATKYGKLLDNVYSKGMDINKFTPKTERLTNEQLIARSIINGDQPPLLTGLYSKSAAVRAELAKKGYDLTKATQDWKATDKLLSTMNSAQQVRLRQAVSFTKESLDVIDQLNEEWRGGNFPLLNKANISAAKSGALGQDAQSLATRLDAQIADLVSELATVYKGGNSSTDESLSLAAKSLNGNFSYNQLKDSVNLIRQNLQIRENSINNTGVAGVGDNQYAPETGTDGDSIPKGTDGADYGLPGYISDGVQWILK